MNDQLVLIEARSDTNKTWQLDPVIREIGRRNVVLARQALQHSRTPAERDHAPAIATLSDSRPDRSLRGDRLVAAA